MLQHAQEQRVRAGEGIAILPAEQQFLASRQIEIAFANLGVVTLGAGARENGRHDLAEDA